MAGCGIARMECVCWQQLTMLSCKQPMAMCLVFMARHGMAIAAPCRAMHAANGMPCHAVQRHAMPCHAVPHHGHTSSHCAFCKQRATIPTPCHVEASHATTHLMPCRNARRQPVDCSPSTPPHFPHRQAAGVHQPRHPRPSVAHRLLLPPPRAAPRGGMGAACCSAGLVLLLPLGYRS